jgi:hypothetical protein
MRKHGHTWDQDPSAFGAVPAQPVTLYIGASTHLNHAITLTGLRFHVVSREPAIRGTLLNAATGCGAAGIYRYGEVNFDSPPPYWVPNARLPADVRAESLRFPYIVTTNSPETLLITVTAKSSYVRWYAELDWIDGAVVGHTKITDHGGPFAITASAGVPGFWWSGSHRQTPPPGQ